MFTGCGREGRIPRPDRPDSATQSSAGAAGTDAVQVITLTGSQTWDSASLFAVTDHYRASVICFQGLIKDPMFHPSSELYFSISKQHHAIHHPNKFNGEDCDRLMWSRSFSLPVKLTPGWTFHMFGGGQKEGVIQRYHSLKIVAL